MTPAFQAVCCSLACAIDALAKASAALAWATAVSKSPAAAAVLAAARACSVGIHWFFSAPARSNVTARHIHGRMMPPPPLRPRARPGDRQAVRHVGQIIFDVAIKLVL